jgi:hypothetical protein
MIRVLPVTASSRKAWVSTMSFIAAVVCSTHGSGWRSKGRERSNQPPVFDLFSVALCARRLCFFLVFRASANLSTICGETAFFAVLAWGSGMTSGSVRLFAGVLIYFSPLCIGLVGKR